MRLTLRAWLSSRRVPPTTLLVVGVGALFALLRPGFYLVLRMAPQPQLNTFIVTLVGAGLAVLGTVALAPLAPEWEHPRRMRVRVSHLATWLVVCALLTSVAPVVTMIDRWVHLSNPGAIMETHVAAVGLAGICVGLLGRGLGTTAFVAIGGAVALVDQSLNHRWIWADWMGHSAHWTLPVLLLAGGALVQARTCGVPRWIERRGPAPE